MNLVLIGYRGTGKSATAGLLADRLGLAAVGMDAELVRRFGKPISEFVAEKGWDAFRDAESELAEELGRKDGLLIDCGGGVVIRAGNVRALRANGRSVWLKAGVDTIARRIGGDDRRPSLTGTKSFVEEIEEVLTQRLPLYEEASDFSVDTDSLTVEQVAEAVLSDWRSALGS